jgi:hypothetical protein
MANVLRRLALRIVGDEMSGVSAGGSLVAVTSRPFLEVAVTGTGLGRAEPRPSEVTLLTGNGEGRTVRRQIRHSARPARWPRR